VLYSYFMTQLDMPNRQTTPMQHTRVLGSSYRCLDKEGKRPQIMAIASALPRLLTATAAPAMTWLPLNVAIVDNDRGDSPSSYRARALGAGAQEVSRGTA